MRYFEKLDIGFPNILTVDVDYLVQHHSTYPFSWVLSYDMVNRDFLRAIAGLGVGLREINLKCSGQGINTWPIHRDEGLQQDQGKINWVINDHESPFVWYQLKSGVADPTFDQDGNPIEGIFYDEHDMDVVCQEVIGSSTLVQTGIPHSIKNYQRRPRFNVQVCLRKGNCLRPAFDEVLEWIEPLRR
jgi:hypothetical protein